MPDKGRDERRVVLVRYGEIGLKGANRPDFEAALIKNLRHVLLPWHGSVRIKRKHGRVFIDLSPGELDATELRKLVAALSRVFGVVSFSPALCVPLKLEAVARAAVRLVEEHKEHVPHDLPLTFKVEARRSNKSFPLTSPEINSWLGGHLLTNVPGLKVDVHRPQLRVEVEIRRNAYVLAEIIPGPGGLPVGTAGRGLLLLSGGIDSPVAGWMAMKRGLKIDALHFHSFPFTGDRSKEKVIRLAKVLAPYNAGMALHVSHFTEVQKAVAELGHPRISLTLARRMMLRIAERIARREGADVLVTGESLGQVASQTLENLSVIEKATDLLILRPLIGFDKEETVNRAREIGTYDISILPYEDCCSLFVPKHPKTRPGLAEIVAVEGELNISALVEEAVDRTESMEFSA